MEVMLWLLVKRKDDFIKSENIREDTNDEVVEFNPVQDNNDKEEESWSSSKSSSLENIVGSSSWASRRHHHHQSVFLDQKQKQKLGSFRISEDDNVSLADIANLDDELNNFDNILDSVATNQRTDQSERRVITSDVQRPRSNEKYLLPIQEDNYLHHQLESTTLPGGLIRTPTTTRNIPHPSNSVLLTPSRLEPMQHNTTGSQGVVPDDWMMLVERSNTRDSLDDWFPQSFFHHLTNNQSSSNMINVYTRLLSFIKETVLNRGSLLDNVLSPKQVLKNFTRITVSNDWLWPPSLIEFVQKSFRISVKIAIDKAVLGAMDHEELSDAVEDTVDNWFVGLETDPEWSENILQEVPNLFSLTGSQSSESSQIIYR